VDDQLASYGAFKVLESRLGETYPGMPWEPKAAFRARRLRPPDVKVRAAALDLKSRRPAWNASQARGWMQP
jgi:hypothetical protein